MVQSLQPASKNKNSNSINPNLPDVILRALLSLQLSNCRFVSLKKPWTIQEEFEFLKMVQDLSVKEFHIIQLAKKQIAALQEILGPLGPSPMALLVKNPPASAGDVGDGFNPWV